MGRCCFILDFWRTVQRKQKDKSEVPGREYYIEKKKFIESQHMITVETTQILTKRDGMLTKLWLLTTMTVVQAEL